MSWTWANPAMLLGLASLAIPVAIHFLNRRRNVVIDWGAMQFLEAGARSRQRVRLTDALLMAARMLILALVVLAMARPAVGPAAKSGGGGGGNATGGNLASAPLDVVLVVDGSASLGRRGGGPAEGAGTTAFERAKAWSTRFVKVLPAGSTIALLLSRERPIRRVEPLSPDKGRVLEAIENLPAPAGSSDLASAVADGLEMLKEGENNRRDVVVLSDGQALPWHVDEAGRWEILQALYRAEGKRAGVEPRLWAVSFAEEVGEASGDIAEGSVGKIELPRGLVPPGLGLLVKAAVRNSGPGELLRRAELFLDGQASGQSQVVGPLPAGSETTVGFRIKLSEPGEHLLSVRLDESADGADPLSANDRSERAVRVTSAVNVLLVDGDRGLEPLSGETDFLRAALAPTEDDAPRVQTRVIDPGELDVAAVRDQKVLVLANVRRLSASGSEAVSRHLEAGGGVLVAPGDRVEAASINRDWYREGKGWLPAKLGEWRGDLKARQAVAQPAPASFGGSMLSAFAEGEEPAIGRAALFGYWVLEPGPASESAAVLGRLNTGDPWVVEKAFRGRGRVLLLAGPLDAEGGTLPVNPDFVPLAHELIYGLGEPETSGREARPGQAISVELEPATGDDEPVKTVSVTTPGGDIVEAVVERRSAGRAFARLEADKADEPGTYRFSLPGGKTAFTTVTTDPREWEPVSLSAQDQRKLEEGWESLRFFENTAELEQEMAVAGAASGVRPLWRWLAMAGLAGLCLEVFLTRRMVLGRGIAQPEVND